MNRPELIYASVPYRLAQKKHLSIVLYLIQDVNPNNQPNMCDTSRNKCSDSRMNEGKA